MARKKNASFASNLFILPHTFEYFVMAHVFGSVIVDVAFYLMLAFGTQGHRFESTSLCLGDMSLSLQLCFLGVVGLSPFFFGGGGSGIFF